MIADMHQTESATTSRHIHLCFDGYFTNEPGFVGSSPISSSNFSGRELEAISCTCFQGPYALLITKPMVSKHRGNSKYRQQPGKSPTGPHPFFIHDRTAEGSGAAPFIVALQCQYQINTQNITHMVKAVATRRVTDIQFHSLHVGNWTPTYHYN